MHTSSSNKTTFIAVVWTTITDLCFVLGIFYFSSFGNAISFSLPPLSLLPRSPCLCLLFSLPLFLSPSLSLALMSFGLPPSLVSLVVHPL